MQVLQHEYILTEVALCRITDTAFVRFLPKSGIQNKAGGVRSNQYRQEHTGVSNQVHAGYQTVSMNSLLICSCMHHKPNSVQLQATPQLLQPCSALSENVLFRSKTSPSGSVSCEKETPWKVLAYAARAVLPVMGTGTFGPVQTMLADARLRPPADPVSTKPPC